MVYGGPLVSVVYGGPLVSVVYGGTFVSMVYGGPLVSVVYGNPLVSMVYGVTILLFSGKGINCVTSVCACMTKQPLLTKCPLRRSSVSTNLSFPLLLFSLLPSVVHLPI